MPGPPPPPPPPMMMMGGPPPPPPAMMGGPPAPPPPSLGMAKMPDRSNLLKDIADPSKPRLRKVDPNLVKDRSKPLVGGTSTPGSSSSGGGGSSNGLGSADTAKSKRISLIS